MKDEVLTPWPPSVVVKSHIRARNLKLKISLKNGLELITPKKFNSKEIPIILEKNRAWIEKQLGKIQNLRKEAYLDTLPQEIFLNFLEQKWKIEYVKMKNQLRLMSRPDNTLVIFGDISKTIICKKLLIKWLRLIAIDHLTKAVKNLSATTHLSYKSVTIRNQSSRWGSCSQDKSINLNFKLLFLPENLVHHVILHELCHTVYFDHSPKFWQLLKKFDPQSDTHKKTIKDIDELIPAWVRVL